jgi:hypothetical protein
MSRSSRIAWDSFRPVQAPSSPSRPAWVVSNWIRYAPVANNSIRSASATKSNSIHSAQVASNLIWPAWIASYFRIYDVGKVISGGGVEGSGRGLTRFDVSAFSWRSWWNYERTRKILCTGCSSHRTPPAPLHLAEGAQVLTCTVGTGKVCGFYSSV